MRTFLPSATRAAIAAAMLTLAAAPGLHAQEERAVPQTRTEQLLSYAPVVKRAQPVERMRQSLKVRLRFMLCISSRPTSQRV